MLSAVSQIVVKEDFDSILNLSGKSFYYEDITRKDDFRDVLFVDKNACIPLFSPIEINDKTLGFTSSAFWVKIPLKYEGNGAKTVILEAGRPITNLVTLWYRDKNNHWQFYTEGDALPIKNKNLVHRSNIFKFRLNKGVDNTLYVRFESDGEALNLNLHLYTPLSFWQKDYYEQLFFGLFFGVMVFAIFSNLFFYITLKQQSYLWYVFYAGSITLLQFSLEGLTAQYIFPFSTNMANRSVLFLAATTVFFVLLYAQKFLELEDLTNKTASKIFNVGKWIALTIVAFSLTNGILYEISFPLINVLALLSMVIISIGMYYSNKEGRTITPYFYLAILSLFVGSLIFICTNLNVLSVSFLTAHSMKFGTGFEIAFLSFSMAGKYGKLQEEKEKAQQDAFEKLQEINKLTDEVNIRLEKEVAERTKQLHKQNILLNQRNKDVTDSILYAATLQQSVMPDLDILQRNLTDSFVLYRPKDIVSGDFYWFARHQDVLYVAIADCTGHGVPGAFMSMLGIDVFNRLLQGDTPPEVDTMLEQLDKEVSAILDGNSSLTIHEHGMDVALCAIREGNTKLDFAGAIRPLYLLRSNDGAPQFQKFNGTKRSIGSRSRNLPFEKQSIPIHKNDWIYIQTDGFNDQFGGSFNKKILRRKYQEILEIACTLPGHQQKEFLGDFFDKWIGELEQLDDVLLMGIKI